MVFWRSGCSCIWCVAWRTHVAGICQATRSRCLWVPGIWMYEKFLIAFFPTSMCLPMVGLKVPIASVSQELAETFFDRVNGLVTEWDPKLRSVRTCVLYFNSWPIWAQRTWWVAGTGMQHFGCLFCSHVRVVTCEESVFGCGLGFRVLFSLSLEAKFSDPWWGPLNGFAG